MTADSRSVIEAALTGRYAVERELGRGGMATVFLAKDLRHDRSVALKVLHPELAMALGAERFQREIRLAARLQHPHILTVHDSGEIPGPPGTPPVLWFTMPFIEGESLRDRLDREHQLPIDDALRIAREAADALDYAHQHGVVHRDIKPENILLSGRHALVADFGIAQAATGDERLTGTGLALGTPAYMSPEQAAGDRNLDARTDIYSLGCVLYEMLAGEPPFSAPTAQAMIARRLTESPRSLRQIRDTIPDAIARAAEKALARSPADRFGSAAEFARALEVPTMATVAAPAAGAAQPAAHPGGGRRTLLVAGIAFLLGLGVLFAWRQTHTNGEGAPTNGTRLLAVLPFENLGDSTDEYFADGVTDEVRGKLAALPGLQVTARTSSNLYKRATKTPQEIGKELGVDYLLTGTVRWEKRGNDSHVRVSPELIQATNAATKWQQSFDASLTDVFQVQADVAGRVAQALDLALGQPQRAALSARPTGDLAAYNAYLKGEELLNTGNTGDLRRAIEAYEGAVALDSGFAVAWAQLSRASSFDYGNSVANAAAAERARQAADRALALAPDRMESHLALGDYYSFVPSDNSKALEQYAQAQRLTPNNADVLSGIALTEQSLGRSEAAVEHFRRALALDPRSARTAHRLARTLLWLRRYPEAAAAGDRAIALAPGGVFALQTRAMVQLAQGDLPGARAVIRTVPAAVDPAAVLSTVATTWDLFWLLDDGQQVRLLGMSPKAFDGNRSTWGLALASTHALRGNVGLARAYADSARIALEAQIADSPRDAQLHVLLGTALAYMGRRAEAIREGLRSVEMLPASKDAYTGPYIQHQLARIYILTGENEKAIDELEQLLRVPYYLSPGWLKIDPTFDPLRKNPRFQKLIEGTS